MIKFQAPSLTKECLKNLQKIKSENITGAFSVAKDVALNVIINPLNQGETSNHTDVSAISSNQCQVMTRIEDSANINVNTPTNVVVTDSNSIQSCHGGSIKVRQD